ncbi:MAG TPA: hypothetical protein VGX91_03445, partial [Candidatus Cybelea sp.]|nr:hypothetical protein [Candidatus Cybelea sp.]
MGQAAGFHVGPLAVEWTVISCVLIIPDGIVRHFGARTAYWNQFKNVRDRVIAGGAVTPRPADDVDVDLLRGWFADPAFVMWLGSPKAGVEVAGQYL